MMEMQMQKPAKPIDTAKALAAIDELLRSVEGHWMPAERKIRAARRALEGLQQALPPAATPDDAR
jgi:hypothetical protein